MQENNRKLMRDATITCDKWSKHHLVIFITLSSTIDLEEDLFNSMAYVHGWRWISQLCNCAGH